MHIAGIICEYNPFHCGHAAHIAATRAAMPDSAVVCVMSGSFVQRGEAACLPMHVRAEAAVRCGADLVVLLPLPWSLASAEGFARGGIALLHALGAGTVSFGSECADVSMLRRAAEVLDDPQTDARVREELASGISFAAARQRAAAAFDPAAAALLSSPNDILGTEYCRAMRAYPGMEPFAVRRSGAHDARGDADGTSAMAVRALIRAGERRRALECMPPEAAACVRAAGTAAVPDPERLDALLMSRLRMLSPGDYFGAGDCAEGLENRLYRAVRESGSVAEACDRAKSKRYAHARLRRILCRAALGLPGEWTRQAPPFTVLLAMNAAGRHVLSECTVPVVSRMSAGTLLPGAAGEMFRLEAEAADLTALASPDPAARAAGGLYRKTPVIL